METNHNPRPPMSDADRIVEWNNRLHEFAGYGAESANLITSFAIKAKSFEMDSRGNPRPAGGLLVTMFIRLGTRLAEAESLSEEDVEGSVREILRFFSVKPLGDTVDQWRTKYSSNGVQRNAVDAFFGFAGRKFHEFSSEEKFLFNVRDAAWPSRREEAAGTGGTFAERFALFAKAIARITTTSNDAVKILFGDFLGVREKIPEWIKVAEDGSMTCSECGSDVAKDSQGHYVCSNPICDYNIAATDAALPSSFTQGPGGTTAAPEREQSGGGRQPREERRDRRDREEREMPNNKPKSKKPPRFRENTEEIPSTQEAPAEAVTTAATPAPEGGFGNLGATLGAQLDSIKLS